VKQGRISQTALKVAIALVTLSVKDDWAQRLPLGLVEASERLLLPSGSVAMTCPPNSCSHIERSVMAEKKTIAVPEYVIWSTLEDTRELVPLEDDRMPTFRTFDSWLADNAARNPVE